MPGEAIEAVGLAQGWNAREDAGWLWAAVLLPLLPVAVVYAPFLQQAFSTMSLSLGDWLYCAAVANSVLWLRKLSKVFARATGRAGHPEPSEA
ncbi:MAG: cation transporting ATPase C-terminal domain-containing protein [Nitrococcus mobilis]|nr:cation transporting ATPase C-terminal domain-containing protein [Nitrococcus mobilis]